MIARDLSWDELTIGLEVKAEYVIDGSVYAHFLGAFADESPIHVDESVAKARGFAGKVMHGAILHGFLSEFVGMRLPGARSLLLSSDLRFAQPCYLGDRLTLRGEITQRVDTHRTVVVGVELHNDTQDTLAARGRVQVKVA